MAPFFVPLLTLRLCVKQFGLGYDSSALAVFAFP